MPWSEIFYRAARRLTNRTTYIIVLVSALAAAVPISLLHALFRNEGAGIFAASLISIVWGWLTWTFELGALSIAATEPPGSSSASIVLRLALSSFGSFLGTALVMVGVVILVALALAVVALIGLGGTTTAPLLALLTPVFLIVGGLGSLLLVAVFRLAFAAVAVESAGATSAVRRAWVLVRDRTADVALWLISDAALVGGGVLALTFVVLVGALFGFAVEAIFFLGGTSFDAANGGIDVNAGIVGAFLLLLCGGLFLSLVVGAIASFSTGSAVGFYLAIREGADPAPDRAALGLSFCDHCGAPRTRGSAFCDRCGIAVAVG